MSENRASPSRPMLRRRTDEQLRTFAAALTSRDLRRALDRTGRADRFNVLPFVPVGLAVSGGVIASTVIAMTSGRVKGGEWWIVVAATVVGFVAGAWQSKALGAELRRVHAIYEAELTRRSEGE